MLFILTGDIQTGKTRWLERLVGELAEAGVQVEGVLAPGVWRERADGEPGERFEKLGIENVLLPGGERLAFARRRDLAQAEGTFDATSQSARAQLGWEISDDAIAQVNRHFARLRELRLQEAAARQAAEGAAPAPRLTVVDELGRLELLRGAGLSEALALLADGPSHARDHALAVVRADLAPLAEEQLAPAWGTPARILPNDAARALVLSALP